MEVLNKYASWVRVNHKKLSMSFKDEFICYLCVSHADFPAQCNLCRSFIHHDDKDVVLDQGFQTSALPTHFKMMFYFSSWH